MRRRRFSASYSVDTRHTPIMKLCRVSHVSDKVSNTRVVYFLELSIYQCHAHVSMAMPARSWQIEREQRWEMAFDDEWKVRREMFQQVKPYCDGKTQRGLWKEWSWQVITVKSSDDSGVRVRLRDDHKVKGTMETSRQGQGEDNDGKINFDWEPTWLLE